MQAQTREGRKRCCFIEHIEIPDGELLGHGLSNFQSSALIGGTRLVVSKLDAAWSRLWLDRESDKLGTCWNGKSLVEWVELFANLGKLTRVNRNKWAVLSFWDGQVLNIERNQIECELSGALLLLVLKNEFEVSGLILGAKCNAVTRVGQLHNFGEHCHIDSEHHRCISSVVLKTFHAKIEAD